MWCLVYYSSLIMFYVIMFTLASLGIGPWFIYTGHDGSDTHQADCSVVNQTVNKQITLEPIYCHDVSECYYGPCGYNVGQCCGNGQECITDYIYNTKLSLHLEYRGTMTNSEVTLKRRGNFTPDNEMLPKVGQLYPCWYQNKLFGSDSITLRPNYFENKVIPGIVLSIGVVITMIGSFLALVVIDDIKWSRPLQEQEGQMNHVAAQYNSMEEGVISGLHDNITEGLHNDVADPIQPYHGTSVQLDSNV